MLVQFKKEHRLGRSESRAEAVTAQPGDRFDLPAWQATELADRQIVQILPKGELPRKYHTEPFVRDRLEHMDKAKVLHKLESRGVKVPKGLDKPALIDLYVSEVDPGKAKVDEKGKGKKGEG